MDAEDTAWGHPCNKLSGGPGKGSSHQGGAAGQGTAGLRLQLLLSVCQEPAAHHRYWWSVLARETPLFGAINQGSTQGKHHPSMFCNSIPVLVLALFPLSVHKTS